MTLTFLDANVLIAAARGNYDAISRTLPILDDPTRSFASNSLMKLELLPKPRWNRRPDEAEFYETYFDAVEKWVTISEPLLKRALDRASALGLGPVDAVHLQTAIDAGASEFITAEKPTKPFFRETVISIVSIATLKYF